MVSIFIDIECNGDPVVMEITGDKEVIFHGYDHEIEAAEFALGLRPHLGAASTCYYLWRFRPEERIDEALIFFATNGYPEATRKMLEAGADVHADDEYALRHAAEGDWTEIVDILLAAGADPFDHENEAIAYAIGNLNDDMIRVFRKHIAEEDRPPELSDYPLED